MIPLRPSSETEYACSRVPCRVVSISGVFQNVRQKISIHVRNLDFMGNLRPNFMHDLNLTVQNFQNGITSSLSIRKNW